MLISNEVTNVTSIWDGSRGLVVENSTRKDVSLESRDRISATANWCSLTDIHLLVTNCLRPRRVKKCYIYLKGDFCNGSSSLIQFGYGLNT